MRALPGGLRGRDQPGRLLLTVRLLRLHASVRGSKIVRHSDEGNHYGGRADADLLDLRAAGTAERSAARGGDGEVRAFVCKRDFRRRDHRSGLVRNRPLDGPGVNLRVKAVGATKRHEQHCHDCSP